MAVDVADPGAVLVAWMGGAARRRRGRVRSWPLLIGGALLGLVALACLAAPLLTPYDPITQDILHQGLPPFSPGHLLGTDAPFGRDLLSRLLYGGRVDLLIGAGGTGVTVIIGTFIGLLAGYVGGRLDSVLMRIVDVFFAFPFLVLVLAIVAMLGPSLLNLFIAIWAVGWVSYARIIRGETLVARQQEYVLAAHALGYSKLRIMVRHILPNVFSAALIFSMADAVGNGRRCAEAIASRYCEKIVYGANIRSARARAASANSARRGHAASNASRNAPAPSATPQSPTSSGTPPLSR